jgi:hypothetical protein
MALRQGWFLGPAHDTLALGTIQNTISDISATFRENNWPNPTKDNDLQLSFILYRQFQAFKNADPKEKQQKAIPTYGIAKIAKQKMAELQYAISQLTILAFFFAMHLCEYVKVQQHKKQRTEILCLQNLWFFKNGRLVDHNDRSLKYANCINITFEMQKKDKKNNTTTQMASGDVTLCPVWAATAIVRRIWSCPGAKDNTPISTSWRNDRIDHITSKQITNALQDAILAIGEDSLHIAANKIGTHSIRLGTAMATFLGGCPVFLIMMIGCWSSNAFLRYIRKHNMRNSTTMSPKKCSTTCFTGTSLSTPPQQFLTSIPGNATIPTMPRHKST